jgi:hypothetical protein
MATERRLKLRSCCFGVWPAQPPRIAGATSQERKLLSRFHVSSCQQIENVASRWKEADAHYVLPAIRRSTRGMER